MRHRRTAAPGTRRRRPVGLIAALLAIVLTMGVAWQAGASNSLPAPGWAVTAAPLVDLLDGDPVAVNVKANDNVDVYSMEVRQCRWGPTYATAIDVSPRSGNCPVSPVSSSADLVLSRAASNGLLTQSKSPDGATINFHVGSGTTVWDTPTGSASLTCDITTPCALVVKLEIGPDVLFQVIKVVFTDSNPIVACGGTAPGVLHAGAADELTDAWAKWTRAYCAANTGGAPSSTAFPGEGSAMNDFLKGDTDIAYGNASIDPATGMILAGAPPRNTVAVPIALNASVLAVGGGFRQFIGGQPADKQAYPQLSIAAGDAAAMLAGGITNLQNDTLPYKSSILATNPALNGIPWWTGANVVASSLPLSSTWYMTKFFTNVVPQAWVDRRAAPPTARGANASLASATPPFTDTTLLTGRPAMGKVALSASINDPDGPLWVFTDRATAASLKIVPAALENAKGVMVAPDGAAMAAAVATMKRNAQGVLVPDLGAATAASGIGTAAVEPYPLTYVEYAYVPAEQLVDPTTCTARTASQSLLTNWLSYVTGDGQANLAPGLEPLTADLKAEAATAIAKVGTAAITGACAGRVTPESSPGAAGTGGGAPAAAVPTATINRPPTAAVTAAPAGLAATDAGAAKKKSAAVAVPAFAGHQIADPLGGVVSLIGIVLLMSMAAWVTAGGSLSGGGQFTPGSLGALTGKRVGSLVLLWGGVGVACLGLVLFQLGPLLEQRDQKSLLSSYRKEVKSAAFSGSGLQSATDGPAPAPPRGAAVGIIEVGALRLQDVVVEGVEASQTRSGPGHVPGTAGLGQPGNAVVVARRNGYGGSFAGLGKLVRGDRIVVTTTQGQSVYAVARVCSQAVTAAVPADDSGTSGGLTKAVDPTEPCKVPKPTGAGTSTTGAAVDPTATTTTVASEKGAAAGAATTTTVAGSTTTTAAPGTTTATVAGSETSQPASVSKQVARSSATASYTKVTLNPLQVSRLYGRSDDDRLTLVTSASKQPWNSSQATVVVAKLLTKPFEPTTQGTRASGETGFGGDSGAWSSVVLALLAFGGVIVAAVALYRKLRFRVAYVLTIAPLVALTIVTAEQMARLLPAWT